MTPIRKVVSILKKNNKLSKEKSLLRLIRGWLLLIFILLLILFVGIQMLHRQQRVIGSSMYPTLRDGDSVVIDTLSYRFVEPSRFDVIVFPFRYQEDTLYIKRIIGLPGETVQIQDGKVFINGAQLDESAYDFDPIAQAGLASAQITLGQDEYFVLGDNRNDSADSREPTVGNISGSEIIGRALLRVLPLNRFGLVR